MVRVHEKAKLLAGASVVSWLLLLLTLAARQQHRVRESFPSRLVRVRAGVDSQGVATTTSSSSSSIANSISPSVSQPEPDPAAAAPAPPPVPPPPPPPYKPPVLTQACPPSNEYEQIQRLWDLGGEALTGHFEIEAAPPEEQRPSLLVMLGVYQNQTYRRQLNFHPSPPAAARYTHEVEVKVNTSQALVLEVREYYLQEMPTDRTYQYNRSYEGRNLSHGGSHFYTSWDVFPVQGHVNGTNWYSRTACHSHDHLNGHYTICCRPPVHAPYGESSIIVFLDATGFRPYLLRQGGKPWRWAIWAHVWIGEKAAEALARNQLPALPFEDLPSCDGGLMSKLSSEGEWAAVGQVPRYIHPVKGCKTPIMTNEEVQSCVANNLDSVTFIGDSHMRQISKWFFGYLQLADEEQAFRHEDFFSSKVRFLWSTDGLNLAGRLNKRPLWYRSKAMTNRDVLIMDTAHWDLQDRPVTRYLNVSLPFVLESLRRLRDDTLRREMRIIYLTAYPMPPQFEGGYRNEYTSAAADRFLVPELEKLGVEVVHVLPIIKARATESTDDHHWGLEGSYEGQYPLDYRFGQVGTEICRIISRMICSTPPSSERQPSLPEEYDR